MIVLNKNNGLNKTIKKMGEIIVWNSLKGENLVYTHISPLTFRGERSVYTEFSGGKDQYILIFPGGKMSRGKI